MLLLMGWDEEGRDKRRRNLLHVPFFSFRLLSHSFAVTENQRFCQNICLHPLSRYQLSKPVTIDWVDRCGIV